MRGIPLIRPLGFTSPITYRISSIWKFLHIHTQLLEVGSCFCCPCCIVRQSCRFLFTLLCCCFNAQFSTIITLLFRSTPFPQSSFNPLFIFSLSGGAIFFGPLIPINCTNWDRCNIDWWLVDWLLSCHIQSFQSNKSLCWSAKWKRQHIPTGKSNVVVTVKYKKKKKS